MVRLRLLSALAISSLLLTACGSSSTNGLPSNAGSVSGKLGAAAAGATVRLEGTSLQAPVSADGRFSLANVPPGEYTLAVTTPGSQGATLMVRVSAGSNTQVDDVELEATGQISGLVTDRATGQPVAGAKITARLTPLLWAYGDVVPPSVVGGAEAAGGAAGRTTETAPSQQPPRYAVTDGAGSYLIPGAAAGAWSLDVVATGYEDAQLGTWVAPNATAPADAQLTRTDPNNASLAGTVLGTSDGQTLPLAAVRVDLWPAEDGPLPLPVAGPNAGSGSTAADGTEPNIDPWCVPPYLLGKSAFTDAQGKYAIGNIEPGQYRLIIWRYGYTRVEREVTLVAKQAATVDATLISNLVTVSGTVRGRSLDGAIAPLEGAWVSAFGNVYLPGPGGPARPDRQVSPPSGGGVSGPTLPMPGMATTDSHGNYRLTCEGGRIVVTAFADGYEWGSVEVDAPAGQKSGVDLQLEAADPNQQPPVPEPGDPRPEVPPGPGGFGQGGGVRPQ